MRLLVDECLPRRLVGLLQSAGMDAVHVVDVAPAATDADLLRLARQGGRVLITEDRGFGNHIVRDETLTIGVVILSGYRTAYRIETEMQRIADIISSLRGSLTDSITIISPMRVRQRKLD